jgi:hypothetical protein
MWAIGTMDPITNELIITKLVPCGCNGNPADPGWDCICDLCRCPHCSCPTEWCHPPPVPASAGLEPGDEDDEEGGGAALTQDEDEAVKDGDDNGEVAVVDDTLDDLDSGVLPLVDDEDWEYLGFSDWEEDLRVGSNAGGDDSDEDEVNHDKVDSEDGDQGDNDDDEPPQVLSAVTKAKKKFLEATIDLLLALMEEQLALMQDASKRRRADEAKLMSTGEGYLDDCLEYGWDSAGEFEELSYAIRMFGEGESVYFV